MMRALETQKKGAKGHRWTTRGVFPWFEKVVGSISEALENPEATKTLFRGSGLGFLGFWRLLPRTLKKKLPP